MRTILRQRGWIGLVAALGVLLQAGALVRHRLAMADAGAQYLAMLADLGSICRASAGAGHAPPSDRSPIPVPSDPQGACPVCLGLVAAFTLAGPEPEPLKVEAGSMALLEGGEVLRPALPRTAHPPARGPPAQA
jgi:hypothetical protein